MLEKLEKEIVLVLQKGLPLESRPFQVIAGRLNVSEGALIYKVREMISRGVIRRFGAVVRHQELGYNANVMAVWKVAADMVDQAGETFSSISEVSHCYLRETGDKWHYNLFTMIHGHTEEECLDIAQSMSEAIGIKEYQLLFSTAELKKESIEYFFNK